MLKVNVTEPRPVQTQFLIFTFFGDYVLERGSAIWTSSLIHLMELLDMSERAVRSALSRMTRKGWVTSEKQGRMSQYKLTPKGRALLVRGGERIFEPIFTDWDGSWQVVVYSLPEEQRDKRHMLRKQLNWLGFGHLAPGTWCSPHDRHVELEELSVELAIEPYVDIFSGAYRGPSSARQLVARCWDLDALADQYTTFIARYEPEFEECRQQIEAGWPLPPEQCFIRRFWLTHEFTTFPMIDPNLPVELLPADWVGLQAHRLFEEYRQLLSEPTNQFVNEIMNGEV
jgi:phenylacetic acid degradation operon negative regulatory protein